MPIPTSALDKQLTSIVKRASTSVVNVSTVRMLQDAFLHLHPVEGVGSGVIIDEAGYIVTNFHVIAGASKVSVTLSDGKRPAGRIVGFDPATDLALIKIDSDNLTAAELGDSDKLMAGQIAIAIGNPFGFVLKGPTVTTGVVSAIGRTIQAQNTVYENLIQTDAAINPGNSGGPLLDFEGKLIGINSAMIPFAQGIGFAIPVNTVKAVVEDLVKFGRVVRPWIGIVGLSNTKELAAYYDFAVPSGVVIARIAADGPAQKAGLHPGDVVLELDGKKVNKMEDLLAILKKKKINESVDVEFMRGSMKHAVRIKLLESPE
jgi:S1-C subfamily serine protease